MVLGYGLLGKEIVKQTNWDFISRNKIDEFDFDNINTYKKYLNDYNQIINCIGYIKTYSDEKEKHWNTNYKGVANLVDYCNQTNKKIIHISTDYVYSNSVIGASEDDVPVHCRNWYGYTKLLADGYIQLKSKNYLLIKTSFKPRPFPYEKAIVTQIGNFDYVNNIAHLIIEAINKGLSGVYNIGTGIKTIYELAKITKPEVEISYEKLHETMPENIIINIY